MTEKQFKEEFLEEMNEIKKEKPERVTVDDIIGLVDCEPTDSVEEVRKLRGRETKQYEYNVNKSQIEKNGYYFALCNIVDAQKIVRELNEKDRQIKVEKFRVNALHEENEQLKSNIKLIEERADKVYDEKEQLKQFISKIDFAIIRKYDNSLENLLDEIYDGEYENWIKKQVSRAKKLDGDVE